MNNRPSPNKTRQIGFLVLIFVLLLGTIYSMTRNTAKESLVYSEVIELFETKQVESFTIDTDGNLDSIGGLAGFVAGEQEQYLHQQLL